MQEDFYNGFLIAPLNWGLGHATRCVPIIRYLMDKKIRVVIASDGEALAYLKKEFPTLNYEVLPSYNVEYTPDNRFISNMFRQLPKFIKAYLDEKACIDDIIRKHNISKIISDNRYGCHHKDTKNILITHQLRPNFTGVLSYLNWPIEQILRLIFDNFNMVWVPDDESSNLTGALSSLPIADKKYIGILSRFEKPESHLITNEILVILSGVEPQRSILEEKIIEQLKCLQLTSVIVSGIDEDNKIENINSYITKYQRLDTKALSILISESKYIICRSGYSSIMDLAVLGKKALLIPTPGQTEQEYLALKLMNEKKFLMQNQQDLNIEQALKQIEDYSGILLPSSQTNHFKDLINKLLD